MIFYILNALIMEILLLPTNCKEAIPYILYFIAWLIIAIAATRLNSKTQYRHEDDYQYESVEDYYQRTAW